MKSDKCSNKHKTAREAEGVYNRMSPSIKKMIDKLERFDSSLDRCDLEQQAYLAIHDAVVNYRNFRDGAKVNMKIETYAHWHLLKHMHATVDANRVIYDVYDQSGEQIGSFHGKEYFQKKYNLPEHSIKTRCAEIDMTMVLNGDDDGDRDWTEHISEEALEWGIVKT